MFESTTFAEKSPARPLCVTIVVWGTWSLLLAFASYTLLQRTYQGPTGDEWPFVPYVTGDQPVTIQWLWSQWFDHRSPLPKAAVVTLAYLTGADFRAPMYLSLALIALLSFACIRTAAHVRGHLVFSDTLFALAFLHWGCLASLFIGLIVQHVLSTVLLGGALLIVWRCPGYVTWRQAIPFGLILLLLPLCGTNGLVLMLPLALWLGYAGASRWAAAKRDTVAAVTVVLLAAIVGALYLFGWHQTEKVPDAGRVSLWIIAAQFLSMSLGFVGQSLWPFSAVIVALPMLGMLAVLVRTIRRAPENRIRASGLFAVGVAILALAVAVGIGRGAERARIGFSWRYSILAVPAMCWVYVAASLYPRGLIRACPPALCGVFVVLLIPNVQAGRELSKKYLAAFRAFEVELAEEKPLKDVAHRHANEFHGREQAVAEGLGMLQRAQLGPFKPSLEEPRRTRVREYLKQAYPVFDPPPYIVSSPMSESWRGDLAALQVTVPGQLRFRMVAGKFALKARYRVFQGPSGYQEAEAVRIRVSVELDEGAEKMVCERTLDPARMESDRGGQTIEATFEMAHRGDLVVRQDLGARWQQPNMLVAWEHMSITPDTEGAARK